MILQKWHLTAHVLMSFFLIISFCFAIRYQPCLLYLKKTARMEIPFSRLIRAPKLFQNIVSPIIYLSTSRKPKQMRHFQTLDLILLFWGPRYQTIQSHLLSSMTL